MTPSLTSDIALLDDLLSQVSRDCYGVDHAELAKELRLLCEQGAASAPDSLGDRVTRRIRQLTLEEITALLKTCTIRFHLVNKAEQLEIARINRRRECEATAESPRPESISEAIARLKAAGLSLEETLAVLTRLDIQPTITAHPTEARRRSILHKQDELAAKLNELRWHDLSPSRRNRIHSDLRQLVHLLFATDEVRTERLQVAEEVDNGLYFLTHSIWQTVPRLYRDVDEALTAYYPPAPRMARGERESALPVGDETQRMLPVFLRYRSWIGGDRDGNPRVTPEITQNTLRSHRRAVIHQYVAALLDLLGELSISDQQASIPDELRRSIEADAALIELSEDVRHELRHELYRLKIQYMLARLDTTLEVPSTYTADAFLNDLTLMQRCLDAGGHTEIARHGRLSDVLHQVRTFGFHLASLDIRQHSAIHETAVNELLRLAQVAPDYATLPEARRLEILRRELYNPRPLLSHHAPVSEQTRSTLEVFEVIRHAVEMDPRSIGSYVVSMTHDISDLLEILLLAKEVGLWRATDGEVECPLDVVPLFETVDDLARGESLMRELYTDPVYAAHLVARGRFQEIMLGYSDSNKDGGYGMSNWALQKAQASLACACLDYNIDFRLFHGRGGTVGRGGGRANRAILATPPECRNGRIRFTEQGEVITFRYALPDITRRHLEQIVSAMIVATGDSHVGHRRSEVGCEENADVACRDRNVAPPTSHIPHSTSHTPHPSSDIPNPTSDIPHTTFSFMERIAGDSMSTYRELIDDPAFWAWYTTVSPIEHISRLPIASRPVSRQAGRADFENLRAIPWVFAWTQMRYTVPGWYGIGAALDGLIRQDPAALPALQTMHRDWAFFHTLINNAQQEMARARLRVAIHYNQLNPSPLHARIQAEFDLARDAILRITGQSRLLDNNRVIQESIDQRNPHTDVLNALQVELLRRYSTASVEERERLRSAMFVSINGIAAAMQSTG